MPMYQPILVIENLAPQSELTLELSALFKGPKALLVSASILTTANSGIDSTVKWIRSLNRFKGQKVGDGRDYIYTLLSLADPKTKELTPLDYTMSYEQLAAKVATLAMEIENGLNILSEAYGRPKPNRSLPSGVPDWHSFPEMGVPPVPVSTYKFSDRQ